MKSYKRQLCFFGVLLLLAMLPVHSAHAEEEKKEEDKTGAPYFYVESTEVNVDSFPLKKTNVIAEINGMIADIHVRQSYANEGNSPINACYVFPASTKVTVHGMQMQIGDQLITAKIKEKEEAKEKIIYYVTDLVQQSQYVNMFKEAGMEAVVLPDKIDQPFVSQLESKNEGIKFARIDADLTDTFKAKTSKKAEKEMEEQAEAVAKLMKKVLKKDAIKVKIEKLKNKKISSMITLSEETRRMQDMMKMYSMQGMGGMDMGMFGKEGETLILNANHPLVQYVIEHQDGDNVKMICEQLYDLALLQQAPLEPEAMTKFVARSNDIMMLLTK